MISRFIVTTLESNGDCLIEFGDVYGLVKRLKCATELFCTDEVENPASNPAIQLVLRLLRNQITIVENAVEDVQDWRMTTITPS